MPLQNYNYEDVSYPWPKKAKFLIWGIQGCSETGALGRGLADLSLASKKYFKNHEPEAPTFQPKITIGPGM